MASLVRFSARELHLLGDLHGRWGRALQALRAAGVCAADGRWDAPPGTVLLQVGDLIDRGRDAPPAPLPLSEAEREARVVDPRRPARAVPLAQVAGGAPGWPGPLLEEERRALRAAQESLAVLQGLRRLEREAADAGGRVIVLLGNHDVDLLRGRFRYAAREKAYLLALLGVAPDQAAAHARAGADPSPAAPELGWLRDRPLLATDGELLAVHGGPPRALSEELLPSLADLDALAARLDRARAAGWDDPLFAEGSSLLSPDGREDDAVADPRLATRLLALAGARRLALGHSPFLHLPKRAWVQADHPTARPAIEAPALLGPGGSVLKLDTNLKRGGPAWVVTRAAGELVAIREDGTRRTLTAPAPAPDVDARLGAPPAEGVSPAEHRGVTRSLDRLADEDPALAARIRAACHRLLALGAPDLAWVRAALRTGDAAPLEEALAGVEARRDALAAALQPRLHGAAPVLFAPARAELEVAGRSLHLAPAAARAARAAVPGAPPVIAAAYFARDGQPFVRLWTVGDGPPAERTRRLRRWPPDPAEVAAAAAEPQLDADEAAVEDVAGEEVPTAGEATPAEAPLPALDPALRAEAERWAAAAGLDPGQVEALPAPGRCRVGPWSLVRLPDGALVPFDTTLVDPARALPVVVGGEVAGAHPEQVLARLDPVEALWSALSEEQWALLQLGELEALGLPEEPPWRAGRFLFCGLDPAACAPFRAFKPRLVRFALQAGELREAVEAGLLTVNLFAASGGAPVSADARWGGVDLAPEVVALGEAGVAWLWRRAEGG